MSWEDQYENRRDSRPKHRVPRLIHGNNFDAYDDEPEITLHEVEKERHKKSMIVISGGRGSGKTTRMLEMIAQALNNGESVLAFTMNKSTIITGLEQNGCHARHFIETEMLRIYETNSHSNVAALAYERSRGRKDRVFVDRADVGAILMLSHMKMNLLTAVTFGTKGDEMLKEQPVEDWIAGNPDIQIIQITNI
jgi:predicted ATPase